MAQEFAKQFYSSKAWQDCRNRYAASKGHLCEDCLKKGLYTPGEIVHHIIQVTPLNINNPEIVLNFDNLRLVCRDCHAEEHKLHKRRYKIDKDGRVYGII